MHRRSVAMTWPRSMPERRHPTSIDALSADRARGGTGVVSIGAAKASCPFARSATSCGLVEDRSCGSSTSASASKSPVADQIFQRGNVDRDMGRRSVPAGRDPRPRATMVLAAAAVMATTSTTEPIPCSGLSLRRSRAKAAAVNTAANAMTSPTNSDHQSCLFTWLIDGSLHSLLQRARPPWNGSFGPFLPNARNA